MYIKICGLTQEIEAEYLNNNHVDFAGFVLFFPKSKRNNTIEQAKRIAKKLSPQIKKVAVVVSPSPDEIQQIEDAGFDYIQIHGVLSNEVLNATNLPILKAFNVKDIEHYETFSRCSKIAGYVFDAQEPGSGTTFDWKLLQNIPRDNKLFLLAGGLTCENVNDAIHFLHPDGVDVSSGVENDNGIGKDPEKIKLFTSKVKKGNVSVLPITSK